MGILGYIELLVCGMVVTCLAMVIVGMAYVGILLFKADHKNAETDNEDDTNAPKLERTDSDEVSYYREALKLMHALFAEKRDDVADDIEHILKCEGSLTTKLYAEPRFVEFEYKGDKLVYDTLTTHLEVWEPGSDTFRALDGVAYTDQQPAEKR